MVYITCGLVYHWIFFKTELLDFVRLRKLRLMTIKNVHYKKILFLLYIIDQLTLNNHLIFGCVFCLLFASFRELVSAIQTQFVFLMGLFLPLLMLTSKCDLFFNHLFFPSKANFHMGTLLILLVFLGTRTFLFNEANILSLSSTSITFRPVITQHQVKYDWVFLGASASLFLFYFFWNFFRDEGKSFLKLIMRETVLKDFEEAPRRLYLRKKKIPIRELAKYYKSNAVGVLRANGVPEEISKKLGLKFGKKGRRADICFKFVWAARVVIMMLKLNRNHELLQLVFERNRFFNRRNKQNNNILRPISRSD